MRFFPLFVFILASLTVGSAQAATWTLKDVVFEDQGWAIGSFDISDTGPVVYSNIDVTTFDASGGVVQRYFDYRTDGFVGGQSIALITSDGLSAGALNFLLSVAPSNLRNADLLMTDEFDLKTSSSVEGTCVFSVSCSIQPTRYVSSGSVSRAPINAVPLPASLPLLFATFTALGLYRRIK